jgi:hypothetical protein
MENNRERAGARLNPLRRRIERWRRTRAKRSPMPQELWAAATELARDYGAYRVARELGVGYGSLKDRLGADGDRGARKAEAFVALDGAALFTPASAVGRGEVELWDGHGTRVVIRLAAGEALDVAALLAAWRRAPA